MIKKDYVTDLILNYKYYFIRNLSFPAKTASHWIILEEQPFEWNSLP
jgi:hypothetical protein